MAAQTVAFPRKAVCIRGLWQQWLLHSGYEMGPFKHKEFFLADVFLLKGSHCTCALGTGTPFSLSTCCDSRPLRPVQAEYAQKGQSVSTCPPEGKVEGKDRTAAKLGLRQKQECPLHVLSVCAAAYAQSCQHSQSHFPEVCAQSPSPE